MNFSEILSSLPVPSTPQVPWQAAILVLFTAAANCMMQPAGRICGASKKYTVYLRSSPLVCFADALTLPMHLINDRCKKKLRMRESIKLIIQQRFNDEESNAQSSKFLGWAWTLFRWLFFVASHLPVMRLSVKSGVLWLRGWVGMFLFSFIITEILIVVFWCLASRSNLPISLPTSSNDLSTITSLQPLSKESSTQKAAEPKSSKIDTETLYFAAFFQINSLLIILRDFWHPSTELDQFTHLCDSSWEVNGGLWFLMLTAVTMSGIYGGPEALGKPFESESKGDGKEDKKKDYSLLYKIGF